MLSNQRLIRSCVFVAALCASPVSAGDLGLVGRWQLAGNARDSSGSGNHGNAQKIDLSAADWSGKPGSAARFDGRTAAIEVPHSRSIDFGSGDFSIALWVHTADSLDDGLGDLVAKFDPETRRGFQFGFMDNVGVTGSQANTRQLQFGIDNGRLEADWSDCGRPGSAILIFAMAVHDDRLYVGTCEAGEREAGHVFRYERPGSWVDCGRPDRCNSISALAVYRGKLYAASAKYRLKGSSLAESTNPHDGGRIFRHEGDTTWVDCGKLPGVEAVHGLVVYRDRLYASSLYQPAGVFRYLGNTQWENCGSPDGKRIEAMTVHDGAIYGTCYDGGLVFRYDGRQWTSCGQLANNTQTYSFAVLGGKLHVGTWNSGRVYRGEADHRWTDLGRLGDELEVMGMAVYNGKLYAGTLPLAEVYRFDGTSRWTKTGRLDHTPDVKYRRAWTMAVYRGKLFCGTLPSGHVYSYEAGKSVTLDRELAAGWRHLAAVKNAGRLLLYVDGRRAAISTAFDRARYNLSNNRPLSIGFGPHDYFNGRAKDVRIYKRALADDEVAAMARAAKSADP